MRDDPNSDSSASTRARREGLASTAGGFWLVSLSPVIVAASDVHGLVMAFWRSWIGCGVLAAILVTKGGMTKSVLRSTAPAGLCFGSSIGLFFWASQITSIVNASLITVLQPIPLMLGAAIVFSEHISARDALFAAVAITGAVVLVLAGGTSGSGDLTGDLMAAISITLGSGYFILSRRSLQTVELVPFMVGMFAWSGAVLTPVVVLSGEGIVPGSGEDWLRVMAVAVFPGIGHVLLNHAHGKTPLHMISILQLLIPVNATLMAYWFLDQSVSWIQATGMAIVIGALALQASSRAPVEPVA